MRAEPDQIDRSTATRLTLISATHRSASPFEVWLSLADPESASGRPVGLTVFDATMAG
jgi:hypothetical protein